MATAAQRVTSAEMLLETMQEYAKRKREPAPVMDDACRICAMIDSRQIGDMNTREVINMFQEGLPGYKTTTDINNFLENAGWGDDALSDDEQTEDERVGIAYPTLVTVHAWCKEFFGK